MKIKFRPALNHDGTPSPDLIPVVLQDFETKEVLFVATMDEEAWQNTYRTGHIHLYSRTEKRVRCKGETSGDRLEVVKVFANCNQDSLLVAVKRLGQQGGVCHKVGRNGQRRPSCFFRVVKIDANTPMSKMEVRAHYGPHV